MEKREDLASILPYLPLVLRSSSLLWPSLSLQALEHLSKGPNQSCVDSGQALFLAILEIRDSLSLSSLSLAFSASDGFSLFFDDLMPRDEAKGWFGVVVPALAELLLQLPSLLEFHYRNSDRVLNRETGRVKTGLRLLDSQQSGTVFLSQELIAALLACSLFCLFPTTIRGSNHLQGINLDDLFASLYNNYKQNLENKIKCIIHYFKRICSSMPVGFVSFERKVLPFKHSSFGVSFLNTEFWNNSPISLCHFKVCKSGGLEDQDSEALEVDFANKYIGGGALGRGCVQEEIRFMINPELIVSILFLPSMEDNEAIEIVGAERFSNYTGYASSFHFSGDHVDNRHVDSLGRLKTRIIAIDAVCCPEMRQYEVEALLREINKAFCGFSDQSKYQHYQKIFDNDRCCSTDDQNVSLDSMSADYHSYPGHEVGIGIATGNWGCGAFGGDPELKAIIQWLAASQALRPFISYFTYGTEALTSLDQVSQWVISHKWTVGELWNVLVDYSSKRLSGETNLGFLVWLLPSLSDHGKHGCCALTSFRFIQS